MAWVDIDPYRVHQLANAAALNTLADNINYLQRPNAATYHHPGTGSDYTVTGTLGMDIDSTNFKLSITTGGGLVMAIFYGVFKVTGGAGRAAIVCSDDTISQLGRNLYNNFHVEFARTSEIGAGWIQFFPGLATGTHEFRAVWGVSGVQTATLLVASRPRMSVWEV